jgi:hypothetical membrane protein
MNGQELKSLARFIRTPHNTVIQGRTVMNKKIRLHPDVWVALGSLILALVGWIDSAKYPEEVRTFPRLFIGTFIVLTVIILIKGIKLTISKRNNPESVKDSEFWINLKTMKYPAIALLLMVLYMVLINYIGMYISSIIYAIATMRVFGEKRWKINISVSVIMVALLYVMMEIALKVTLPQGILIKMLLKLF